MSSKLDLVLTRARADDLAEIVHVCYNSFPKDERTLFQGCPTTEQLPFVLDRHLHRMKTDASDVWMQVREKESGTLVAASNWKVYVKGTPDDAGPYIPDWLSKEDCEHSRRVIEMTTAARKEAMSRPFIRTMHLP